MSNKFKVQIEGQEHEVDLPDGYIHKDELGEKYVDKSLLDTEVNRAAAKARKTARDSLKRDKEFWAEMATEYGVPVADDGMYKRPKEQDIDINKIRSEVEHSIFEKEVKPRDEKLNRLLQQGLYTDIIQAAASVGVRRQLLEPLQEGIAPPIVQMVKEYFAYDEENDYWAVREGDKFSYSTNPVNGRPYAGAKEFLERLKKNAVWSEFFDDNRQRGPEYSSNKGGAKGQIRTKADFKSDEEKSGYISEHGLDAFNALPKK